MSTQEQLRSTENERRLQERIADLTAVLRMVEATMDQAGSLLPDGATMHAVRKVLAKVPA